MVRSPGMRRLSVDDTVAAIIGFLLVLLPGANEGWYDDASWMPAVIALFGVAAIRVLLGARPTLGSYDYLMIGAFGALAVLMALSGTWGVTGSEPSLESRRALLYIAALVALITCVAPGAERRLLEGATAGTTCLATWALVARIADPNPPSDPFQGTLLNTPIGYANALGVVAAMGTLMAVGLSTTAKSALASRGWRAAALVLVSALVLTESRGAVLALAAGAVVAALLMPASRRGDLVGATAAIAAPAAATVALAPHTSGVALAIVVLGTAALAAAIPPPHIGRRIALVFVVGALVVGVSVTAAELTSRPSHRTDYWLVALETAWDEAPLGAGAGSFDDEWRRRRPVPVDVRDAHSLYIEIFAELGVAGLVLVGCLAGVPIVAAIRYRNRELTAISAGAYSVYVVHAGLDWDWEMPVVTLTALVAASAALAVSRPARRCGYGASGHGGCRDVGCGA
jgi:O-antigen ligase